MHDISDQPPQTLNRKEIIDKSINVENILALLITHRFFPGSGINANFLQVVLYDPHANTAFKVSVYEKCYRDTPKQVLEALRRLFSIRNLFAHCGLHIISLVDPDSSGVMDPKNLNTPLDFEKLRTEFLEKEEICLGHLFEKVDTLGLKECHDFAPLRPNS
jgi:hypothetical protein